MTFKAEMPLVDLKAIAMLTGKAINVGTVNVPKRELLPASASNTITLAATPVSGTLTIYALVADRDIGTAQTAGNPATTENTYSISGKVITLNSTTAPETTNFIVNYSYSAPATTTTTTFTADKFAGYVRVIGTGLITDAVTGALVPTVFDIKKAKAKNNFTITQKSTESTKLTLDFDLYSIDITDGIGGIDKVYVVMNALT